MGNNIENRMVVDSQWEPAGKAVCQCEYCGCNIYPGDSYYNFNGETICDGCAWEYVRDNFRQTAE